MIDKLDALVEKYHELGLKMADQEIINDNKLWQSIVIEHNELTPIIDAYTRYKDILTAQKDAQEILDTTSDKEMEEMAYMEIGELKEQEEATYLELQKLLIPTDPNDKKNVIIEIRAGAGGDEAGLFAAELMRMYLRYAESRRWKTEMLDISETGVGGIKEASFMIKGNGAYSRLKFESGTHRVQRIPATESGGRIHTSTATVAVLPEVDEVEIEINPNDVRLDVFRSGGHGGQSVNTTDSAVRVTHIPTGIVATCQDGKSQQMNREQAMKVLRARLYEKAMAEQTDAIASERRLQIGTGDRSAKIRTYNFPQSRITDHRIHMTTHQLESFLMGNIDEMVDALISYHQAESLQEMEH